MEDCLAINVIRPHGYQNQNLLAAVWIHGGGFVMSGSTDRRYNLSFIVQSSVAIGKPIIGVSFNYRLSGRGFLQDDGFQSQGVANLGLTQDLIKQLFYPLEVDELGTGNIPLTVVRRTSSPSCMFRCKCEGRIATLYIAALQLYSEASELSRSNLSLKNALFLFDW